MYRRRARGELMSSAAFVNACASYSLTHHHIACEWLFLPTAFESDHAMANLVHQLGPRGVFVANDRDAHDFLWGTDALFLRVVGGLWGVTAVVELVPSAAVKCYTDASVAAGKLANDLEPRLLFARSEQKLTRKASLLAATAAAEVSAPAPVQCFFAGAHVLFNMHGDC